MKLSTEDKIVPKSFWSMVVSSCVIIPLGLAQHSWLLILLGGAIFLGGFAGITVVIFSEPSN